jgi:hypothetical protein
MGYDRALYVLAARKAPRSAAALLTRELFAAVLAGASFLNAHATEPTAPVDVSPELIVSEDCNANQDFQGGGYTIRSVRLESPFRNLPWLSARMNAAEQALKALEGKPFVTAEVAQKRGELWDLNFPPDSGGQRVRVLVPKTKVEACEGKSVGLVYSVYSSQILPSFVVGIEALNAAPEKTAGAAAVTGRLRLTPRFNYGSAQNLMGGGRVEYSPSNSADGLIGNLTVDVSNSSTAHDRSLALSGAKEHTDGGFARWIAHSEWQLDYRDQMQPSEQSQLNSRRLAAQWLAVTPPLGKLKLPIRFGAALENGRLDSNFTQAQLAPDTVPSDNYNSLKLFLGTTNRLERSAFSASYGLEAGMLGSTSRRDWVKHVVDLAHEVSIATANAHRPVEIESRFTAGLIQVKGAVPVATRFIGGSREDAFIAGDSWSMRANPFIRSFPAGRFGRENGAAGGTRFAAFNLTMAYPIWNKPLVPDEVAKTDDVKGAIKFALNTATNALATDALAKDQRLGPALSELFSGLRDGLAALIKDVEVARPSALNASPEMFDACVNAVEAATETATSAMTADYEERNQAVITLLPRTTSAGVYKPGQINAALSACVSDLNSALGNASIAQDGKLLADKLTDSKYMQLKAEALKMAAEEMAPVGHTIRTLFNEVNIASVSPVLMFDAARMDSDRRLGTRYGIGLGLRATLVNSVDFTLGYMANPFRAAGDSAGAFFFTMQIRDLF